MVDRVGQSADYEYNSSCRLILYGGGNRRSCCPNVETENNGGVLRKVGVYSEIAVRNCESRAVYVAL